jgi:hypothetical protein
MSEENEKRQFTFFSDSLLLFLIPVYVYGLLYMYEQGFCGTFDIPASLISINIFIFANGLFYIIVLILFILILMEYFHGKNYTKKNWFYYLINSIAGITIFFLALFPLLGFSWQGIIFFCSFILVYNILFYLLTKLSGSKELDRLKKIKDEQDQSKLSVLDKLVLRIGAYKFFIVLLSLVAFMLANSVGNIVAVKKRYYTVINSSPELVVVRQYSNNLICAEINRDKKQIKKQYYIKTIEQIAEEGNYLSLEEIGPITLEEQKTIKK